MPSWARDLAGFVLLLCGAALLVAGVVVLRTHDYLAGTLLLGAGLSASRASVDLLRVTVGQ